MTPEQNKRFEDWVKKYSTERIYLDDPITNVINCCVDTANYIFTHLSPGGWVRASERLPKPLIAPELHYEIEGRKVYGNFYDKNGEGEIVFGVLGHGLFEDYDVPKKWFDKIYWYDETLSPSDKDKDLSTNELFKFYIKNEPVNFYLSNILRLPEEKQIQLRDALADRLPKDEKDKEIQQLRAWKQEAMLVYAPIMDWGHANKELPLGASIVEEIMKRVKGSEAKDKEIATMKDTLLKKSAKWYSDYVKSKDKEIERLRGVLADIQVYWNRNRNDASMFDACWYAIDVATEALNTKEVKDGD